MKEVEFHTGVVDSLGFACRLLRKAYRQGARVLVTAPQPELGQLDRLLWTFDERDFVPHVRVTGSDPAVRGRTPIWLADSTRACPAGEAPRVLVNLGADAPADMGFIDRLIEVVDAEPEATARGRERWRGYKAAGLQIVHHGGGESRA